LVTGATSAIGLGIAKALARAGCNLTINGFGDKSEINDICTSLAAEHGVDVRYSSADMRKPDQIEAMMLQARETFGSLDVLVNNAGIQFVSPIESFPTEKWDDIIAINRTSAFHTTKAVIPGMLAKGWGRIINVASAHALVASPFKSAYVAAKHGLAGLTKTVALEVAEKVSRSMRLRRVMLKPLWCWARLQIPKARGITAEEVVRDVMLAAQPSKKMIGIEQVADLAIYLCSESASGITGSILPIDGGWTAR